MQSGSLSDAIAARQERIRVLTARRKIPALLITNLTNIFYMTGFRGSAGVAVFGSSEAVLWVDPRYILQARAEAKGVEVIEEKGRPLKAVGRWLRKKKPEWLGYEDSNLTCAQLRDLEREAPRARLKPAGGLIEELRAVKDAGEIEKIRKAATVTAAVLEQVLPRVRPGVAESDLAAEIEFSMKRQGAERAAFETIVASGPRSALPHARASPKLLQKSELVVIDLGAILGGYAADMTRTLYLGRPSRRVRRLYGSVLHAQRRAIDAIRPGVRAGDVDRAARSVLARYGLEKFFTHSTGHGVGLEIHERPRLARREKARLAVGCVLTAEPGIYLEGFGGIRIEDTVLVGPQGPEILTPAPKDRWFIA